MATLNTSSSSASSWNGPAIGLLDLDAFFASVEQLEHPEWRGKPVIVAGDAERRGVVSTASYEARKYGVHSAMSSAQARKLCPEGVWVHPHFERYSYYSKKVMDIIADETPYVEQVSIDEAFFDVTPGHFSAENPVDICMRIQARVQALGITCSIGLSSTKSVAKIASDIDKPNGLYVVPQESVRSFLAPLPVSALSGIGPKTAATLKALHIHTLGDLAQAPPEMLASLGANGKTIQNRALGLGDSRVSLAQDVREMKSISHEHTFADDVRDPLLLKRALATLCDTLSARLRAKEKVTNCVAIKLKNAGFTSKSMQMMLSSPTDSETTLQKAAFQLLDKAYTGEPLRLIGLSFTHLSEKTAPIQLELGTSEDNVSKVKDAIRNRFGKGALRAGWDVGFEQGDQPRQSKKGKK